MTIESKIHVLTIPANRPTDAPQIVDYLLHTALKANATDIHIGLNQHDGKVAPIVRLRVYNKLEVLKNDYISSSYREVINRIKTMADIKTTDIGIPQDGQIHIQYGQNNLIVRVATIPVGSYEEIVIRLQSNRATIKSIDDLMMTRQMHEQIKNLLQQKSGLIVVCGPAGSGKTTTIYTFLQHLASPEKKILTAEDPIELFLPFVSHVQVTERANYDKLGKAFMRQDAQIIFLGEIRSAESALSAIQLAQTGHLVMTTVHTKDAVSVLSRLEAYDIHPNFIAGTLIACLNQRLVPTLCKHCRQEYQPAEQQLKKMHDIYPPPKDVKFFKEGPGCNKCYSGITGRTPVYELFLVSTEMVDLINRKATLAEIQTIAKQHGMLTLAQEALIRVYLGVVDLNSVFHLISQINY